MLGLAAVAGTWGASVSSLPPHQQARQAWLRLIRSAEREVSRSSER